MSDSKWYFTEEQLANSPSRKCGINAELELSYRQRAANLIQEMGQRLQVSQLCINTAIVYMHRFYAFHSFTMFHRNSIASAAFFLAAKVEEQPRKLEHVIKILNICLEKTDMTRDTYAEQAQELVLNENILLQTLGFDVAIDHPHTHVVKACQLFNIVTVSRELRQTCYFMASNSLHLTTMCLKYRPTVVAAFCIYIACKWSRWEIPDSSEGKAWYSYVDETVTLDTLKKLTEEYLQILERSPSKFKSKMKAITSNGQAGVNQSPGISDGPSTSHHKSHDKHHHHHHKNMSSATNSMNVNANGSSRSSSKAQLHQMPSSNSSSSSSSQYKQGPPSQSSSSSSSMNSVPPAGSNHGLPHRQRPPQSYSQPNSSSSSSSQSKPSSMMDERYYNSSQRLPDHSKHRLSSNSAPHPPLPPTQQQPPPPQPYNMKMGMSDQKGLMSKQVPPYPSVPGMDMHQQKKSSSSSSDYHSSSSSRNSTMNPQQIPNNVQKKTSWPQQQQQPPSTLHNQQEKQYPHLQKNIQMSSSSGSSSSSNAMPPTGQNALDTSSASNLLNSSSKTNQSSYNEMKQQQHASQNDFWFNDKINEMSSKTSPPTRQIKSLFSPSPEHDTNEKVKYMMMSGSLKSSNAAVNSPKEDKKLTPTKRDKSMLANQQLSQKLNNPPSTVAPSQLPTNQMDKKFSSKVDGMSIPSINPPLPTDPAMNDAQLMKKRSYSSIKDSLDSSHNRDSKMRKVEQIKTEPTVSVVAQQPPSYGAIDQTMTPIPSKQPIETNPDIVKSLLAECFSSNKFDAYDTDSPLDVINPEPPEELLATPTPVSMNISVNTQQHQPASQQLVTTKRSDSIDDLLDIKDDKMDSSAGESSRKDHKKKSKKKKEKHKHKKKHKSSDREDNKSDSSSLKIIFSKDGRNDSKSSPESFSGGIKIKIPINKDAAQAAVSGKNDNPAPIKLKISKEKFGSFTNSNNSSSSNNNNNNNNNNNSTSSSSHHHKSKKDSKDKDREKSKSKSSKHYSGSSEYKESNNFQHI